MPAFINASARNPQEIRILWIFHNYLLGIARIPVPIFPLSMCIMVCMLVVCFREGFTSYGGRSSSGMSDSGIILYGSYRRGLRISGNSVGYFVVFWGVKQLAG